MGLSWTQRLAMACAVHRWRTVAIWGAVLVLAFGAIGGLLSSALTTEGDVASKPESVRGEDLLDDQFPDRNVYDEYIVVQSAKFTTSDPQFADVVSTLRSDVSGAPEVEQVANPLTAPPSNHLVSADGSAVLLPVAMTDDGESGIVDVIDAVEAADGPDFTTTITGEFTVGNDFLEISERDLQQGEIQFGLPAALIVLLIVFGAVVAAMVPIGIAIVSIIVTVGLSAVAGQVFELSFFLVNMVVAMGLALGIDYTLFVASRYREERAAGLEKLDAIAVSGATASKAVFFSGMSFVVALLGMLLVPDTVLRSLAFGAIVVGLVTVAAALTLLPAVLSLLGDRIERWHIPFVPAQHGGESRFWKRAVGIVTARPVITATATTLILLALAAPVLLLKTGNSGITTMPDSAVGKVGFTALSQSFPQGARPAPAEIVIDADPTSPEVSAAIDRLEAALAQDDSFGSTTVSAAPDNAVGLVQVPLTDDPNSDAARAAVQQLRDDLVPAAFAGVDADVFVTGATALDIDYSALIDFWLPLVLAFVLGLSFLLLLLVFRSVVLPLKAVVLNLLSVGAAYGLMVLVFQEGFGNGLLGLQHVEAVAPWVPVFLFSVLFALSMDYHVFLLTRIRERYLATGDTVDAVAHGVGATGRIITGAALIIVVVFIGFATGDLVDFQQMGFGVGVALLLDATVIRTILVPSSMVLLGKWNWYLPSWLEWLPELHIEGGVEGEAEEHVLHSDAVVGSAHDGDQAPGVVHDHLTGGPKR